MYPDFPPCIHNFVFIAGFLQLLTMMYLFFKCGYSVWGSLRFLNVLWIIPSKWDNLDHFFFKYFNILPVFVLFLGLRRHACYQYDIALQGTDSL